MTNKIGDFKNVAEAIDKQQHSVVPHYTKRQTYAYSFENDDGTFSSYLRVQRPCLGELRSYRSHDPQATDDVYMPGDLSAPFPQGKPVSVTYVIPRTSSYDNDYMLWAYTGEDSPWRKATKEIELHNKNGILEAVTFHKPDVHSDLLVSLFMNTRSSSLIYLKEAIKKYGYFNAFVLSAFFTFYSGRYNAQHNSNYYLRPPLDIQGLKTGSYLNLSDDPSCYWTNRFSYRRPIIEKALTTDGKFRLDVGKGKYGLKDLQQFVDLIEKA